MPKVRTLILRTAGTNCERETAHAFRRAGSRVELEHLDRVLDRPAILAEYGILALPGGFTYGDDLGAGTIFANRIRTSLLEHLSGFVGRGGLVLGICNGFQILVKTGLLPALDGPGTTGEATLTTNDTNRFEDRWVLLEVASDRSPFVAKGDRIFCPVAHHEGKFVTRDRKTLDRLEASGQVVFRYVARDGAAGPAYPDNPNGSWNAVAGVCDPTGRVLGLMPHPERHLEPEHHPHWPRHGRAEEGDGLRLFRNAVAAASEA
jgi:phosphoribosylformylglycinamidine synthase